MKKRTLKRLVRMAVILSAVIALFFTVRIFVTTVLLAENKIAYLYYTEQWAKAQWWEKGYYEALLQDLIAERKAMNSATQWYLSPLFARSNWAIKLFLLADICFVDYWITRLLVVLVKSYIQMKRRKRRRHRHSHAELRTNI